MAWSLNSLKYGWKIAAGISLAAVTIFVATNERERVNQADINEIVLGTTERCLATQYATNPSYYVSPPSIVRSWYSNDYQTTNVPGDLVTNWHAVLYTNTFTNVIGWRTDRAMMVELDAKIKALVPYYADTNTVYDGTTNISMLTVTGLWASLSIGDGTNQFTSVPEYVGTNGTTNAATYGAFPWRVYKEDLEERYKVLNALKIFSSTPTISGTNWDGWGDFGTDWPAAKNSAENEWVFRSRPTTFAEIQQSAIGIQGGGGYYDTELFGSVWTLFSNTSTSISHKVSFYVTVETPDFFRGLGITITNDSNKTFDGYGVLSSTNGWKLIDKTGWQSSFINTSTLLGGINIPHWCDQPNTPPLEGAYYAKSRGYRIRSGQALTQFIFLYCTNKYW